MDDAIVETRLNDVEQRLAHFERMADDLSAVIADQGKTIAEMQRQLGACTQSLRDVMGMVEAAQPDDKPPPHY